MEISYKVKLKKLKLDKDTEKKYNQIYDLSNMIRENETWKYGECMVLDDEKLLFSLSYHYNGAIAEREDGKDWYGLNRFIFHIVEKNSEIIIKYLNLKRIEEKAMEFADSKIKNLGYYQKIRLGIVQQEYKDYIRNEAMKVVKVNKKEFEDMINDLGKIQYNELDYFSCGLAYESIDYFDYINKITFYCDRYYPKKYEKCIEFINYLLKQCNILNMEKVNLKSFNEEEKQEIMINMIKEKIRQNGGYLV